MVDEEGEGQVHRIGVVEPMIDLRLDDGCVHGGEDACALVILGLHSLEDGEELNDVRVPVQETVVSMRAKAWRNRMTWSSARSSRASRDHR